MRYVAASLVVGKYGWLFMKLFKEYRSNTAGNMAVTFAIGTTMLLTGIGAAVDYSIISKKKTEYQSIADAAVLAAARSGLGKKKDKDDFGDNLQKIARKVAKANNHTGDKLKVKLKINKKTGIIRVTVSSKRKTFIMGLFGKSKVDISAVADAPLSISDPANIVLVLDTTFSMSGQKMDTLKKASKKLVSTLSEYDNENLRMGVVPFAQYVNVGMNNRNAPWIYDTQDYKVQTGTNCYYPVIGQTNCRTETYGPTPPSPPGTCYNDGVAYSCGGSSGSPGGSYEACDNIYANTQTCEPVYKTYKWYGCVGSRQTPWHERVKYKGVKIPGLYNTGCGASLQPLTNNLSLVSSKIDELNPQGETYMPAGIMWGWRLLDRGQPFNEANAKYKNNTRSVMILMTDGFNTKSKNYGTPKEKWHNDSNRADADKLTATLCKKIKNKKIDVYTIAFAVSDMNAKKIIKNCASNPSYYFDAKDSAGLEQAFEDIGQSLLKLRLTH